MAIDEFLARRGLVQIGVASADEIAAFCGCGADEARDWLDLHAEFCERVAAGDGEARRWRRAAVDLWKVSVDGRERLRADLRDLGALGHPSLASEADEVTARIRNMSTGAEETISMLERGEGAGDLEGRVRHCGMRLAAAATSLRRLSAARGGVDADIADNERLSRRLAALAGRSAKAAR